MKPKKWPLLLIPILLGALMWAANWKRWHPPPTPEDAKMEKVLGRANKLEISTTAYSKNRTSLHSRKIASFKRRDFDVLTRGFRLQAKDAPLPVGGFPPLEFRFMQGELELARFTTQNRWGQPIQDSVVSGKPNDESSYAVRRLLAFTTSRVWLDWIRAHPEIEQKTRKLQHTPRNYGRKKALKYFEGAR